MNQKGHIARTIEALDNIINDLKNGETNSLFKYRDTFFYLFFDNNKLKDVFVEIFPIDKLGEISSYLRSYTQLSSFSSSDIPLYIRNMEQIKSYLYAGVKSVEFRVFYSWQSSLPNNTNRGFIKIALSNAINQLNDELLLNTILDSDTQGVPGSPDIVNAILKKIDVADVFVCDISFVAHGIEKGIPNPNVLFELGYALSKLGDQKIILLFNEAYGKTKDLPFDLGLKRLLIYNCRTNDEDKLAKKKDLTKRLYSSLKSINDNK